MAGYSTADDCMHWLCETYDISEKYDEKMRRYIAGVRYEMTLKEFSELNNKFVMAADISEDTVQELKELDQMLTGVDISENWERQYLDGTLAPHLRGVVGAISEEQYNEYLKRADKELSPIVKRRWKIPMEKGLYAEIDIYPFWKKQAICEVETETVEQTYTLPDFIEVIREVSEDKDYTNRSMAFFAPLEDEGL